MRNRRGRRRCSSRHVATTVAADNSATSGAWHERVSGRDRAVPVSGRVRHGGEAVTRGGRCFPTAQYMFCVTFFWRYRRADKSEKKKKNAIKIRKNRNKQ